MTKKEAIAELKCSIELTHFNPLTGETSEWLNGENQRYVDACNMAIKALKQEPILDKIRAEIIELRSKQNCSCADCLDIIDKYRSESEVEQ